MNTAKYIHDLEQEIIDLKYKIAAEQELSRRLYNEINHSKACNNCINCNEEMWCTFFANGTTVQPNFLCNGYESKEIK